MIEEIITLVKENVKPKTKIVTRNIQEIGESMTKSNLRIIEIGETQFKGTEDIFNKIVEQNFPNLKKGGWILN